MSLVASDPATTIQELTADSMIQSLIYDLYKFQVLKSSTTKRKHMKTYIT